MAVDGGVAVGRRSLQDVVVADVVFVAVRFGQGLRARGIVRPARGGPSPRHHAVSLLRVLLHLWMLLVHLLAVAVVVVLTSML